MLSFIKRLFGIGNRGNLGNVVHHPDGGFTVYPDGVTPPRADDLAALASDPKRQREFLSALAVQGIWIITEPRHGQADGEVQFLDYTENGVNVFPVFSSMDEASRFIQRLPHKTVAAYECVNVNISFLFENNFSKTRLLLNPKTESETVITANDLAAVQEIAGT
ncbi:MAG: SseB family protein [Planctomycetota bacterium]|nr:SseB family protein [Planctomycetota bacterium]